MQSQFQLVPETTAGIDAILIGQLLLSNGVSLLLYYRKLRSNLEKFLGIQVAVETLLTHEGLVGIVLQLLPEGRTYEERGALRDNI